MPAQYQGKADIKGVLDGFDMPLTIPENRLDADQYSADDIDGVTESLFGSGNLGHAVLQASQTDAAIALSEAVNLESALTADQGSGLFSGGLHQHMDIDSSGGWPAIGQNIPTDTDRALEFGDIAGPESLSAEGDFAGAMVGALGASAFSSDAGAFSSVSGAGLDGPVNIDQSATISNTTNIVNIDVDDTVQNIVNTVNETINNIVNLGDEIIEAILEGDITEIVNILTSEINEITEILNTQIENITETINNFLEETGVTEIINQVTEITNEITETVTTTINEVLDNLVGGGITVDLGTDVLDALGTDILLTFDDTLSGNVDTGLVSDNLFGIVDELTGLDLPFVADTGLDISLNLLDGSASDDGSDITINGLDTPDISLDVIECVVGDIDIEITLPADLLDPAAPLEGADDLIAGLEDFSLAEPDEILGILGEQGTFGETAVLLGDTAILDESFEAGVDDIIADITAAAGVEDILPDEALTDITGAIDEMIEGGGVDGDMIWTETLIGDGGLFDDIAGGFGDDLDTLPDPVGTVAEGLGVLDTTPELDVSSFGGLFG